MVVFTRKFGTDVLMSNAYYCLDFYRIDVRVSIPLSIIL